MKTIYGKTLDPEEIYRLTNLIEAGYEGYSRVSEENVIKAVDLYIKEQDRLQSLYEKRK